MLAVALAVALYGLAVPASAAPVTAAASAVPAAVAAVVPAQSTPSVQAGVFVPVQGRAVDTRSGLGGITGPVTANTWYPFQILGQADVPSTGVDSVLVNLTVVGGTTSNAAQLVPNTARHRDTTVLFSGAGDTISNSAVIAVGTDGKLALISSTSQQFIVDVQGYFTSGATPAPGGFASVPTSRVVDTRNGTGYPAGAWSGTAVKSLALKGKGGIPDTATAVFANITVISTDPGGVSFATLPGDGFANMTDPGTTLNFRSNETTAIAAVLDLNAAGVVDIKHYASATGVHVLVDIQGYFDGQVSTSSFTTVESRIYDSRTPNTPIPANSTVEVQIGGVGGLPAASPNVAGVVMNITPLTSSGYGFLTLWPSDETEPNLSSVNYTADSVSNTIVVRPSATTGKVKIKNTGSSNVHIIIDSQGWFNNANLLPPVTANGTESGSRGKASMIEHTLTDSSKLALNPTNGNAVLTGRLFHIRGVGQDMNVAWRYNSKYDHRPTLSLGSQETSLRSDAGTGNMIYTAPDGGWYTFTLTGSTYTMPSEMNAALTKVSPYEYQLRFNDTGITNTYRDNGHNFVLERSLDTHILNPNDVYYEYDDNRRLAKTFDTQDRTVSYVYNDTRNLNQPSAITDNSLNRTVNIEYGGGEGRMSKITDATGAVTTFAYTNGKLTSLTDGRTNTTALAYAADSWVSTITYGSGSPAAATTTVTHNTGPTLSYLTDGNGKQTTYTLDPSKTRVIKTTDPNGNTGDFTFDGHDNRLTSTNGLGQSTTAAFNPNNSLTKITSPAAGNAGAETSFTYPTATGDPWLNYRPATATSSEGHISSIQYDPNTKKPSKILTPDSLGGTPQRFYQDDALGTTCGAKPGSLCRSTDGKGNATAYTYDAAGNPVTITRPAPLGAITNTYDAAGRILTSKDGKNQTATYTYDKNDRPTQIRYGATCAAATCVTYVYDAAGNLTTRTDASGTTTYTWDAQNRPTGKTIGGVTTSVTYDDASNILTSVDPLGTVTYRYDAANRLTALAEPGGSCPATPAFPNSTKCTGFGYDNADRRTTTKYPNGVVNTTAYDTAGKIQSITAKNTSAAVLASRAYTYTLNGTKDGSLRKTMTTEAPIVVTTYGYDKINRLTSAIIGSSTETWSYDANSNRTLATKTGAANIHSAFNAADQLCWTGSATGTCTTPPAGATDYNYDANGNTTAAGTATIAWNVFDQLTSTTIAGTTTNYTYAGLRNNERLTAGATSFLNGTLGTTRQTTGGASTSFIRDPDGNLISMRTSAGASYYYTTDALGSVIALTDTTQAKVATYTYDSWGKTTTTGTQAATNPWQYAGGYKDTTTGYTKFGARYYNPTIGRFTQPDPSGQETNNYQYAAANPTNFTDPTGYFYVQVGWALCFIGCAGGSFGWDAANGFYVGGTGGVGYRAEASIGADISLFGEAGGADSTAAECAKIPGVGDAFGISLPNPIGSYWSPSAGFGVGCSLMFTRY